MAELTEEAEGVAFDSGRIPRSISGFGRKAGNRKLRRRGKRN